MIRFQFPATRCRFSLGAKGRMRGLLTTAVCLSFGCTPFPVVRDIAASSPGCFYFARSAEKIVALTIDDGPDRRTTPRILELLREHESRATFFLISSRVSGNDSLVVQALRAGNEIGNHMSRNEVSIQLTPGQFEESLAEADSVLGRFAELRWARPGSGFYNGRMLSIMRKHGYACALGSVYPFDPQVPSARYASRTILNGVRNGSVIVLHDGGYKGRNTVRVLSRLLPALRQRVFRVVTLSELVAADTAP